MCLFLSDDRHIEDFEIVLVLPETLDCFEPLGSRHHDIGDDEIELGFGGEPYAVIAVIGGLNAVIAALEEGDDKMAKHLIVVYYQDSGHAVPGIKCSCLRSAARGHLAVTALGEAYENRGPLRRPGRGPTATPSSRASR